MGEKKLKNLLDAQKKDIAKRVKAYKANKAALDEEAFGIMDFDTDNKISLEEFLSTFDPDGKKYKDLLVALGFMTEQERIQQEQAEKIAEGGIAAMLGEEGEDG